MSREPPTLDYAHPEKPIPGAFWQFIGQVVMALLALGLVGSVLTALVDLVISPYLLHP